MWTVLAVLFCTVVSAQAAEITYQLKTHVDGRTITATTNLNPGDALEANMPQKMWRAYTTYKYYSDAALTEEITTVPENVSTVYVDYVFEPPFALSDDDYTIWYMLRAFYANSNPYYWYADDGKVHANTNLTDNDDKAKWAFYGDAYCLNMKNKVSNEWLAFPAGCEHPSQSDKFEPIFSENQLETGWQLYLSTYEVNHIQQWVLGVPQEDDELSVYNGVLGLENMSGHTYIVTPHKEDNSAFWNDQAVLDYSKNKTMWCLFFGTIAPDAQNVWHVEYRIFDEESNLLDRKFYDKDVVERPVDYYYDGSDLQQEFMYYHDAEFSIVWDPQDRNDLIPVQGVTVVYIKVITHNYISEPWKTLVIPFEIEDLQTFFGLDNEDVPAVDVLELQEIQDGVITSAGDQDFYRCKLIFNPVSKIEAYKPYLIRVNKADPRALVELYTGEGQAPCKVTTVADPDNAGITVSMEGTLEPNGYNMDASDGLHFYFGYDENAEAYNFYRVSNTIPKNRCWFYVNDNRTTGAKLNVSFDMNAVTGINQAVVSANATDGRIYNINGQQVKNTLQKGIYIVNGKKVIVK